MSEPVPFEGVMPALITPFTADGSAVDGAALGLTAEEAATLGGLIDALRPGA